MLNIQKSDQKVQYSFYGKFEDFWKIWKQEIKGGNMRPLIIRRQYLVQKSGAAAIVTNDEHRRLGYRGPPNLSRNKQFFSQATREHQYRLNKIKQ
jgi:hypothetical protein